MLVWGITPFAAVAVSVPNYRSLGGIKCGDRVVRHNTILRSATPSNATAADVAYLRGTLQLASVVDLRAPEEALKDPGARRLPEKVDHVYHSIFDEPMLREGLRRKLLRAPPGGPPALHATIRFFPIEIMSPRICVYSAEPLTRMKLPALSSH